MAAGRFSSKLTQAVAVVCAMLLVPGDAILLAQDQPPQAPPPPAQAPLPPNALDSLVAPVALYPDPLLSQILVASTYPLELVEAEQWLQRNSVLTGPALTQAAAQQNWDPSVQALVVFPDLMRRLTQDITWTTNLGNAFLAQQSDVMDAVQRMRASAQQAGKLSSTPQQQVITDTQNGQPVIEIEPANPQVIYVPQYDPALIWGAPFYYPYPGWWSGIGFGFGLGISMGFYFGLGWGGWGGWGWRPGWGGHTVIVNNTFIHRNGFNTGRIGNVHGGNAVWSHDSFHRQGVPYANQALSNQYRAPARANLGSQQGAQQGFRSAPSAPSERIGNRQVPAPNNNRSAFGGAESGAAARAHSDHGFSSMGPARSGGGGGFSRGGGGGGARGGGRR